MKGIVLHPLRIAALDRMSVLRVPFREQPTGTVYEIHGAWYHRLQEGACSPQDETERLAPPYAPGEYFVAESWMLYHTINSVVRSDGRSYEEVSDGLAAYKEDGYGTVNDFIKHIQLVSGADFRGIEVKATRWLPAKTMPSWAARHILTIGPPVPMRLGDVTEEMVWDEGLRGLHVVKKKYPMTLMGAYMQWWNAIYPRHPYSPDLWTWGYPMEVRKR